MEMSCGAALQSRAGAPVPARICPSPAAPAWTLTGGAEAPRRLKPAPPRGVRSSSVWTRFIGRCLC
jgi:hypothetical protein